MTVTQQELLDAMDGIVMLIDRGLRIVRIGSPNWQRFMDDNLPQDRTDRERSGEAVLWRPVTEFFAGDTVREVFAELFDSVLSGARPIVRIDYRCDAPGLRRDMRLTVGPVRKGDAVSHLLYQSVQLSTEPRAAIPLFGAPVAAKDADDILTLCAICARVAWPIGAPAGEREWVEPAEYYRLGGGEVALISHGFCESCFARLRDAD